MRNNWYNKNIRKISGIIREEEIGLKRKFDDLVVNVEHPAGTDRYGVDPEGKEWRVKMKYDYGFLPSFKGENGEGLDVYVGPNHKSKHVYIIHQNNPRTGEYDEGKCMMGFDEEEKAKKHISIIMTAINSLVLCLQYRLKNLRILLKIKRIKKLNGRRK